MKTNDPQHRERFFLGIAAIVFGALLVELLVHMDWTAREVPLVIGLPQVFSCIGLGALVTICFVVGLSKWDK